MMSDVFSVSGAVKNLEASLRGIDLEALRNEAFSGPHHEALVRAHRDRVRRWELEVVFRRFYRTLNEYGEIHRRKERLRRERIRAKKLEGRYTFSDEVLQIAMRSLDEAGSM
jgi:hypothetical protein